MHCRMAIMLLPVLAWLVSSTDAAKVLVLGAGGAGLAAAHELERLGISDVTIVEAGASIGGRMMSAEFGGDVVQLGANWVQGTEGSWLWELVKQGGVRGTFQDWDSVTVTDRDESDDYDYDYEYFIGPSWERYEQVRECQVSLSAELEESGQSDISVRQADRICGWRPTDEIEKVIEWFYHDYEFAEPPVTTSTKHALPLSAYEYHKDEDYFVTDSRGWLPALEALAVPASKVMLNTTVNSIKYTPTAVTVGAIDASGQEITLSADYAIVTFSIGVLQHEHEAMFSPALPPWLQREILKFDMNTYTKIFMRFDSKFWGNEELFLYADERRGYYPIWQNMEAKGFFPNGTHMLMVTVTGEESARIEAQDDATTQAEAMEVLRTLFGVDTPNCTDILIPRWRQMPRFRGSYSNWPIGVTRADHTELRTPVDRLFISGEATHPSLSGWVHGALESGRQTARDVAACVAEPQGAACLCAYDRGCDTYTAETDPAFQPPSTNATDPACPPSQEKACDCQEEVPSSAVSTAQPAALLSTLLPAIFVMFASRACV